MSDELVRLRRENKILVQGIASVQDLIDESKGVYGLHLNGDHSPWHEILEGGYMEEWLLQFSLATTLAQELSDDC